MNRFLRFVFNFILCSYFPLRAPEPVTISDLAIVLGIPGSNFSELIS
jgi:hypothetical protein